MSDRIKRRKYLKEYQKKRKDLRRERRKKHLCIDCGSPVKPVLVYHQRCKKHHEKYCYKKEKGEKEKWN